MKFSYRQRDNTQKIEQGVWVSLDDDVFDNHLVIDDPKDGPAIRVASTESRLYRNAYDKVTKSGQDVIRAQNWVPPDLRRAAERAALLAACTDWRIRDEEGHAVPFDRDALISLFNNQLQVVQRLEMVAGNLGRYQQEEDRADAENLPRTSNTYSNGSTTSGEESLGTKPLH